MKRLCAAFFAVMIVSVSTCAFMGNAAAPTDDVPTVDETTETVDVPDAESETETTEETKTDESALDVVSAFIGQLQERYGEDYQAYYDAIIERWGSVEVYLLSLAEDGTVPDVAKEGYENFIGFLSETAPIWGSALAIFCVILIIVFGKKALTRVRTLFDGTAGKWKKAFDELNKQSDALKAQNDALRKLLGENARFDDERKNLDATKENLSK